ncbi:glycine betaine ABC transporter substrate-binding protein [Halomonas getboli]|uniref:glycine betaine ABC transporter substrate-binding protein n=1 Tax=Halomonas getboli TaxID=2935862 RepID=UPI001FFF5460|nr:glycine betaine ABC transporter substrate-binding protein [Halomonas getboli]MCK2185227.1 glycine betaine ABC transporter substrate-binding protein [Halomonas getboli]
MKPITTLTLCMTLGTLGIGNAAAADTSLTIGTNNWSENIAVSNLWQQLLEDRGYDVTLKTTGKSIIFSALAQRDLDISLEVWLPNGDAQYLEPYQDRIDVHGAWYNGAQDELVVPAYLSDINTMADLKANAERFVYQGEPTIMGIESGAAIAGETEAAIERYDLPFRQLNSSSPAMIASLDEAYRQEAPIAVTLWQPHWAYAQYDLKAIEDPKGAYGGGDDIKWMSRLGFSDDHPDVVAMLNEWHMSHAQLADLMLTIEDVGSPEEGVRRWIDGHPGLIDQWLNDSENADS